MIKHFNEIPVLEHFVVQKYLNNPYLIEGLKFDLRLYVLLAGVDPMRIFLYNDGLVRLATSPYKPADSRNIKNLQMHLTNYAINKFSKNFVFNTSEEQMDVGHKRNIKFLMKHLKDEGHNVALLMKKIKRLIIKTFAVGQPRLLQHYRSSQPNDFYGQMCFEILGFDVLIDTKMKPWLLEINYTPSFKCDTPLDYVIKKGVVKEAI